MDQASGMTPNTLEVLLLLGEMIEILSKAREVNTIVNNPPERSTQDQKIERIREYRVLKKHCSSAAMRAVDLLDCENNDKGIDHLVDQIAMVIDRLDAMREDLDERASALQSLIDCNALTAGEIEFRKEWLLTYLGSRLDEENRDDAGKTRKARLSKTDKLVRVKEGSEQVLFDCGFGTATVTLTVHSREELDDLQFKLSHDSMIHGMVEYHVDNAAIAEAPPETWRSVYEDGYNTNLLADIVTITEHRTARID
jgi:hypothetical protein